MKILFISKLNGDKTRGPNNSVPAQINSLKKISNLMWINISKSRIPNWRLLDYYVELDDINEISSYIIKYNPNIVCFQQVYFIEYYVISKTLIQNNIPYVIIPRSTLTYIAQNRKKFKKTIGNYLFFKSFISYAAGIHFLSLSEKNQTSRFSFRYSFIIPNGISEAKISKNTEGNNINASYIGRIETHQKGLDLLIKAINHCSSTLRNSNFHLSIYGPNIDNSIRKITKDIMLYKLHDLVSIQPEIIGDNKKRILNNTDLFILTSRYEGLPMGLLEALSYGIPSLVTIGTNMSEEINSYNAGWIADSTVESISNALRNATIDKSLYNEKSLNALKLSREYIWDSISIKTIIEYEKIIKNDLL